jgi:uncharacterized protein YdbL (DUF1318 family)
MTRFLVLLLALGFAAPVMAADALDTAKANGCVGERPDGLLGKVKDCAGVDAVMGDVNARRLAKFNEIAKAQGQDVTTVRAVAGADFINRTASGNYVMDTSGAWVKK